ncbi:MAG: HEAT repeat domain-containing protein [Candidatus Hydrogenedentes bacterium]|nr:HEAT repeat domain-containing protein [Candidatus Hydrogenedentota bacterium]
MGTRTYPPSDPVHWLFLAHDPNDKELFRPLLESKNELLVSAACLYMGRIHNQESFDSLARLTQHPSPGVRRMAAEALGMLGRPEAVPILLKLKNDPNSDVRDGLSSQLRHLPGEEASHALLDIYLHDDNSLQRDFALQNLRERRDVSVFPGLVASLDTVKGVYDADMIHMTLAVLSGHDILGDYRDPERRAELKEQWRRWWADNGASHPPTHVQPQPESTYCGLGVVLTSAEHLYRNNTVRIQAEPVGERGGGVPFMIPDGTPLLVPVDDKAIDNFVQYIVFQNGREVERGEIPARGSGDRYMIVPFGPIARGLTIRPSAFETHLSPGDYEAQIEVRSLCTELTYFDYPGNVWGSGARETQAEVFTLKSNRVPLAIHAPAALSSESMDELARIMAEPSNKFRKCVLSYTTTQAGAFTETVAIESPGTASFILRSADAAALPVVLAHFDAKAATYAQLEFLMVCDDPRAKAALDEVKRVGDDRMRSVLEQRKPKDVSELVAAATLEIGGKGWSWSESRIALEALDGKLGSGDVAFAKDLVNELEQRLAEKRDHHAGRPGESLWGAFRTEFFLGCIGDPVAVPVLRRAAELSRPERGDWEANSQIILLRWYAAAALKLIDVQGMPAATRTKEIKKWIRHCFSSPEEHYMARSRLLPYLRQFLGDEGQSFFTELAHTLQDPWMVSDAKRLAQTTPQQTAG